MGCTGLNGSVHIMQLNITNSCVAVVSKNKLQSQSEKKSHSVNEPLENTVKTFSDQNEHGNEITPGIEIFIGSRSEWMSFPYPLN